MVFEIETIAAPVDVEPVVNDNAPGAVDVALAVDEPAAVPETVNVKIPQSPAVTDPKDVL